MTSRFSRFTRKARSEPRTRFTSLMGLLFEPAGLRASFERQNGSKAALRGWGPQGGLCEGVGGPARRPLWPHPSSGLPPEAGAP